MYAAEKKEIAVSVDCPEDLTVFHDSKWTSEALFNLLDNAVKYYPAGGKIAVSMVLWEMYGVLGMGETGFAQGEARLHEVDKERSHERPTGVDGAEHNFSYLPRM